MNQKNNFIDDVKSILDNSYKTFKFPPNNRFINTNAFLLYAKEVLNNEDKHTNINFPDSYDVKKPIKITKPNYIYIYVPTNLNTKINKLMYRLYHNIAKHDNDENNIIVLDFSGTKIIDYTYIVLFRPFTDIDLIVNSFNLNLILDNKGILKVINKTTMEINLETEYKYVYTGKIKFKELHVICDGKNIILSLLKQFSCFAYIYNNYTSKTYFYNDININYKNKSYDMSIVSSLTEDIYQEQSNCTIIESDIPKNLYPL